MIEETCMSRYCCCWSVALHCHCNTVRYIGTKTHNDYGVGSGQIWLDNVQCNGTEIDIGDCTHTDWGVHNCEHHEDIAISCSIGTPTVTVVNCCKLHQRLR